METVGNLYYRKTGKGNPVVLLHGFPNDGSTWNPVIAELEQQFTLLIPDLPGAGRSPLPEDTELTMGYLALCVHQMLEQEGIDRAVIAGHSMGGYTALELAARFPNCIAGLALVHSSSYADSDEKKENRRKAIQLIRKGHTEQETFLRAMAGNLFSGSFRDQHPEAIQQVVNKGMELPGENLCAFYGAIMQRGDKTDVLKNAAFPVAHIIGDEDTATPMKDALEQCHLPAVSAVHIYSPCGHMSMIEHPQKLAGDLSHFISYCF